MDNRPFYELDDDEILLEEAADAALSDAVPPVSVKATTAPALPLRSPLDRAQIAALAERFALKRSLTLLDHAFLIGRLACTLDAELVDRYGFAAAVRSETAALLLDMSRVGTGSRSNDVTLPKDGIERVRTAPLDYRAMPLPGLSLRLERAAATGFGADFGGAGNFLAFRRLTLALLPGLTPIPLLTDTVERYTVSARILINTAAAKQALLPWRDIAGLTDDIAERDARSVVDRLREHAGAFDI